MKSAGDNPSNMRKKSGFFRRKLGSPQFDSNLDTLPTSVHLADAVLSQDRDKVLGRGPPTHQAERHTDTTPLVPTIPPQYRENDAPSLDVSSHATCNMQIHSQLARASQGFNSFNPPTDSVLTSASSSTFSEEPKWDKGISVPSTLSTTPILPPSYKLHPSLHQESYLPNSVFASDHCHPSAPLESFLQLTGLKATGTTPVLSNLVACEKPPMSSPPSLARLTNLQANSRQAVSNGERSDLPSSRTSQPHSASAHCPTHSLSTTLTCPESSKLKIHKSGRKSSSIPATTTFLSSSLSLATATDQPFFSSCPSHRSRGPSVSSLFLDHNSLSRRPSILNQSEMIEEDELRLSLETWKLDLDGVLQGGLPSLTSSQTPTSLNSNSDRAFMKTSPLPTQHNHSKISPSDNSAPPSSHCLPSLVNPNRTAIQSRSSGAPSSKSSTYPGPVKCLGSVNHSRIALFPGAVSSATSPPPPRDKNLLTGSRSSDSNIDAPQHLTFSTTIHQLQPRALGPDSPKECSDPNYDAALTLRHERTQDGDATTPGLAHSPSPVESALSPVESTLVSPRLLKSSQLSTKTIRQPSPVTLVKETAHVDDDNYINDYKSPLSPSIRLASSPQTTAFQPEFLNLDPSTQSPLSLSATCSPKLAQSTPSTPPSSLKSVSEPADLITSSTLTGRASPTARIDCCKTVTTKHVERAGGGGGLGKQPTKLTNNPSSPPLIPQLQRCHIDKSFLAKHSLKPESSRSPRSHQSSPNLRNLRSPPIPDLSFFSVVVSEPTQSIENASVSLLDESEHFNSAPGPASRQSSVTSVDLNASLLIPGMTVEANALRLAEMFWQDDETIVKPQKLTEWLGSPESSVNQLQILTRRAFLNKFDFKDLRVDVAFRKLCSKMYLKGETQQVDRILAEFSRRYWEQNQSNLYFTPDMVHALSYSILLLNTDLHVVDTVFKMSRSQFIRNTMETIGVQLSHLELSEASRPKTSRESSRPSFDTGEAPRNTLRLSLVNRSRRASIIDMARTPLSTVSSTLAPTRPSMERWREALRSGSQPTIQPIRPPRSFTNRSTEDDAYAGPDPHSPSSESPARATTMDQIFFCDTNISTPPPSDKPDEGFRLSLLSAQDTSTSVLKGDKYFKAQLERELEALLKDIYAAIKANPIAQSLVESHLQSPGQYGSLKRITSRRNQNSYGTGDRHTCNKRASSRGFSGFSSMLPVGMDAPPSRPNTPTLSPSMSSSSGMMGYSSNGGSSLNLTNFTTPSIGFVSKLSQSIIREQNEEELFEHNQKTDGHTCDSELALLGAPWAKEGILQRKQYWESKGKRHKDKSWAEVFVVIQEGTLQMFRFGQNTGSKRAGGSEAPKLNSDSSDQMAVGGGNWLPNAQLVGEICLSHALTSILVSGYSKDRTHVFVLTLSNGASYFFQTGTEELVHEWVSTCNYWAARLSKEPLTGGVSNMEYGWNHLLEIDLIGSSEKKEELQDCQREQEEMMSIGSGQSEQSHKARSHLRDRIFNGFPLGSSILSDQVTHSAQANDLNNWSTSGCVLNSLSISSHLGSATSSKINLDRHHARSSNISDKLFINEWNPPLPPTTLSTLTETAQMQNLKRHNSHIQMELEEHNQLRKPITNLYWNRPNHLQKAMANWEKKAQYLMAEIIKYTTYLNALEQTIQVKQDLTSAT